MRRERAVACCVAFFVPFGTDNLPVWRRALGRALDRLLNGERTQRMAIIIRNLDDQAKKRILAAWNDGIPAKDIGARFSMSDKTVRVVIDGFRTTGHVIKERSAARDGAVRR